MLCIGFLVLGRIYLVDKPRLRWILNDQPLTFDAVLEESAFRGIHAFNAQPLAQNQPLGDDELLFVDRDDDVAVLLPRIDSPGDRLAHRLVDDLDLFAPGVDLELGWYDIDLGANHDFAKLAHLAIRNQLLLAQLEHALLARLERTVFQRGYVRPGQRCC
jgi:hypothetical protein